MLQKKWKPERQTPLNNAKEPPLRAALPVLFGITGRLAGLAAAVVGAAAVILLGRLFFGFSLDFLGLLLFFFGLFLLFGLGSRLFFLLLPGSAALGLAAAAGTGSLGLLRLLDRFCRCLLYLFHLIIFEVIQLSMFYQLQFHLSKH